VVNDRLHISPRFVDITFPIGEGLVQVQDGDLLAERYFIEKRNLQPELFLNELPVAESHGDDEITPVDQFLGQPFRLEMTGWIVVVFASIPADATWKEECRWSCARNAYSAAILRKTFPVQTNRIDCGMAGSLPFF
jgi:hypothetical protein